MLERGKLIHDRQSSAYLGCQIHKLRMHEHDLQQSEPQTEGNKSLVCTIHVQSLGCTAGNRLHDLCVH